MDKLDELLTHHGVKGMRWGVRKQRGTGRVTVGEKLGSLKRERQWKKMLKDIDKMTNEQLTTASRRIQLENELKRLSKKSPVATSKDKADYVRRGKMTTDELSNKVIRLRVKDNLARSIKDASKEQRALGKKIVDAGGHIAIRYAKTKSIQPKDLFDAVNNPKPIKSQALDELFKGEKKSK